MKIDVTIYHMNVFDFYKSITGSIADYLIFIASMAVLYLAFSVIVTFLVDQFCKIIMFIRAPIRIPETDSNSNSSKNKTTNSVE